MNIKRHSDRLDGLLTKYEQEIRVTEETLRVLKARRHNVHLAQKSGPPLNLTEKPEKDRMPGAEHFIYRTASDLWPRRFWKAFSPATPPQLMRKSALKYLLP